MQLLNDIHHLTFITGDMDRLIGFYQRIFGARVTVDMEEEGLRHAFIEVGPHTVLHPFQVPGVEPPGQQPMFARGRLDHFALNAASEEAFRGEPGQTAVGKHLSGCSRAEDKAAWQNSSSAADPQFAEQDSPPPSCQKVFNADKQGSSTAAKMEI